MRLLTLLFGNSSLLFLSLAVQRVAALAFLWFLTYHASKETLSLHALFLSLLALAGILFSAGLHTTPTRLMFDHPRGLPRDKFIFTMQLGVLGISAVCSLVLVTLAWLAPSLLETSLSPRDVLLVGCCAFFAAAFEFYRAYMRAEGSFILYSMTSILRHGGALLYILALHASGWTIALPQIVHGYLISTAVSFFAGLIFTRKTLTASVSPEIAFLKPALLFSLPLVFHTLFGWLVEHSGRWIGVKVIGLEGMAVYMLVVQIITSVGAIPRTLLEVRIPEIGRAVESSDLPQASKIIDRTSIVSLLLLLLFYATAGLLMNLYERHLPPHYHIRPAHFLLAFLANGIDLVYLNGYQKLILHKQTSSVATSMLIAGSLSVVGTFIAVSLFKTDLSILVSYLFSLGALALFSHLFLLISNRKAA